MEYRKKPVVIKAVQLCKNNTKEVLEFMGQKVDLNCDMAFQRWEEYCNLVKEEGLTIHTLEGDMIVSIGDYIIKGVNGEFYPCKPDIFEKTYEKVN